MQQDRDNSIRPAGHGFFKRRHDIHWGGDQQLRFSDHAAECNGRKPHLSDEPGEFSAVCAGSCSCCTRNAGVEHAATFGCPARDYCG